MDKLSRDQLFTLEKYAAERAAFRRQVLQHKRHRRVQLGEHLGIYFEDRLTIQYQIQEMLRIERIFEPDAIQEELDAYNPLIPDGSNWKATVMLEYEDPEERKGQLALLKGIEHMIWIRVDGHEPVFGIANEDLERSNEEKTSAVHFMRFELDKDMVQAAQDGAGISMGCKHALYNHETSLNNETRQSLLADLHG